MRTVDPDGDCNSCSGKGRLPANADAAAELRAEFNARRIAIYDRAARIIEGEYDG